MSLEQTGRSLLRKQAVRLADLLGREGTPLRAALVGRRRAGKSDLLRQVYGLLFQKAEGPLPFWYAFEAGIGEPSRARHFVAAFCQQMRAFLLRQEEFLGEPAAPLEKELERPGLPLSLAELGRDFLALAEGDRGDFAAALPAQFAHREGRPVCLLLDDVEACGPDSRFLTFLSRPSLCWLLAGRRPFLRRAAGHRDWILTPVEPFSSDEALAIAERACHEFDLGFSYQAWEAWFEVAGASPGWVRNLIESAVLAGQALDSAEALARCYAKELTAGSLGSWLAGRWERAIPDRKERAKVAQHLASLNKGEMPVAEVPLPIAVWEGLIAEEWAEETAWGPVVELGMAERDWLSLVHPGWPGGQIASPAGAGSQQAQARVLQAFLQRTDQARQWRQVSEMLKEVREGLLQLPESGFAGALPASGEPVRLPSICSMAREQTVGAELFWCYGFHGTRRDRPEAACLFLIALCHEEPLAKEVSRWSRRLEEEARKLPQVGVPDAPPSADLGPRSELWVVVPPGVSLKKAASERRMRWETLAQLLAQKGDVERIAASPVRSKPGDQSEVRLSELEARARWLEEELSAAREQFRKELNQTELGASVPGELMPFLPSVTSGEGGDLYWRMAMSLSLLLVSTDLLAVQLQSNPEKLGAVRDLQLQSQRLLKALRGMEEGSPPEKSGRKPKGPSKP
jgi:hypothetical protein